MLATEFLCRARSVAANSLAHLLIACDSLAERTATNDFLLCRRKLFKFQTWLSAKLSHGTLQHYIEVFPDKADIGISQIQNRSDAHDFQLLVDTMPTPQTSLTGNTAISLR
ncbi:Uncharacterised protein [Salmonella enterica subsp. arizonae]|uniref:Uncharacterized protein n=1 Tax=Salmonella enterica subsp. arizonae TaxID=59203 RepID=A0A2X4TFB1_SALER|nr:Uncharacterised protein [Salmonella enterica subsp. arizonae]